MRTLQADLVPPQRLHRLLEELVAAGRLARHVVLLPLDRHLERLEDFLDAVGHLLADTVTGHERDGVLAWSQGTVVRKYD